MQSAPEIFPHHFNRWSPIQFSREAELLLHPDRKLLQRLLPIPVLPGLSLPQSQKKLLLGAPWPAAQELDGEKLA